MDDEAERVRPWLEGLGFRLTPEPPFITSGRRPDFFCEGPFDLWVEVKTPERSALWRSLEDVRTELVDRVQKIAGTGYVDVAVGTSITSDVAASVARYLRRVVEQPDDGIARTVVVPRGPVLRRHVRIQYSTSDGTTVEQHGPASTEDRYAHFPGLEPDWQSIVDVHEVGGTTRRERAFKVLDAHEGTVALRHYPGDKPLHVGSVSSAEARLRTGQERIRRLVEDANGQLRNGASFREAPGVLVILHDELDALDEQGLLAALIGNLTYTIAPGGHASTPFLGADGVFRPDKNRSVSAVRYATRHRTDFVVNPHAHRPIEWRRLVDRAFVAGNGNVTLRQSGWPMPRS